MSILCIGEMLIDFISQDNGMNFKKEAGGCIANVAAACSILGQKSSIITNLGDDDFGYFLLETLKNERVDTSYVKIDKNSFTPLAFVSLNEKGDRSFSFYFKNSSALNISEDILDKVNLDNVKIVHFASIAIQGKSKNTHLKLIKKAKDKGIKISFDVNLRFNLWDDIDKYYESIMEFLPYVDILKISDNELSFVAKTDDIESARKNVFSHIEYILFTKGEHGSLVYRNDEKVSTIIPEVEVIDTTGAGDGYVAAFLTKLANGETNLEKMATFATNFASKSTTKKGAISSYEYMD